MGPILSSSPKNLNETLNGLYAGDCEWLGLHCRDWPGFAPIVNRNAAQAQRSLTSAERDRMADPTCGWLAGSTDRIGRRDSSQRRANHSNVGKAIFKLMDTFECTAASSPGASSGTVGAACQTNWIGDMRMKMR